MNRTTCALVAAAVSSLISLSACGSLSRDTSKDTPSATAGSPTVAGTAATRPSGGPTMSMGEHTPIPANTDPLSAAEIYQKSRKGVFLVFGTLPDGSSTWGTAFIHDLGGEVAITNAHVVDGVQGPHAVFFDGTAGRRRGVRSVC